MLLRLLECIHLLEEVEFPRYCRSSNANMMPFGIGTFILVIVVFCVLLMICEHFFSTKEIKDIRNKHVVVSA